jgi:hypothetical protein
MWDVDVQIGNEVRARRQVGKQVQPCTMEILQVKIQRLATLSEKLLDLTDSMLLFERQETKGFRAVVYEIWRDTDLMIYLLRSVPDTKKDSFSEVLKTDHGQVEMLHKSVESMQRVLETESNGASGITYLKQKLQTTEREYHGIIMTPIVTKRRVLLDRKITLASSFKAVWATYLFDGQQVTASKPGKDTDHEVQVEWLLESFERTPFCIGLHKTSSIQPTLQDRQELPAMRQYQRLMRKAGNMWANDRSGSSPTIHALSEVRNDLLQLAWIGEGTLSKVDPQAFGVKEDNCRDFIDEKEAFVNSLRDSILRHNTDIFSMVFVGQEDAGKSTFLNAIIGMRLLPSSGESPRLWISMCC